MSGRYRVEPPYPPLTGITVPLPSDYGSSRMSVMLSIGLLVSIRMRRHMF
ncbi:MAG TPA: hypothetical protein VEY88_18920 [Archangium sp.]|nr:hypothetical protein [Archangium sp.]